MLFMKTLEIATQFARKTKTKRKIILQIRVMQVYRLSKVSGEVWPPPDIGFSIDLRYSEA